MKPLHSWWCLTNRKVKYLKQTTVCSVNSYTQCSQYSLSALTQAHNKNIVTWRSIVYHCTVDGALWTEKDELLHISDQLVHFRRYAVKPMRQLVHRFLHERPCCVGWCRILQPEHKCRLQRNIDSLENTCCFVVNCAVDARVCDTCNISITEIIRQHNDMGLQLVAPAPQAVRLSFQIFLKIRTTLVHPNTRAIVR